MSTAGPVLRLTSGQIRGRTEHGQSVGNLTAGAAAFLIGDGPTDEAAALSTQVRAAWTGFAATGDPAWPAFEASVGKTWVIDVEPSIADYPEAISRELWAGHDFAPIDLAR